MNPAHFGPLLPRTAPCDPANQRAAAGCSQVLPLCTFLQDLTVFSQLLPSISSEARVSRLREFCQVTVPILTNALCSSAEFDVFEELYLHKC